eukprot:GHVR01147384.1.p1 GENE.GHVR01147384.1~~GHVR01147384.1.p1  ORF type:complete len:295 (+),score=72.57 GHVR01147384.1:53-886(+)
MLLIVIFSIIFNYISISNCIDINKRYNENHTDHFLSQGSALIPSYHKPIKYSFIQDTLALSDTSNISTSDPTVTTPTASSVPNVPTPSSVPTPIVPSNDDPQLDSKGISDSKGGLPPPFLKQCPGETRLDARCNNFTNQNICAKVKDTDFFKVTHMNDVSDSVGRGGYLCVSKGEVEAYVLLSGGWKNANQTIKIFCSATDIASVYPDPSTTTPQGDSTNEAQQKYVPPPTAEDKPTIARPEKELHPSEVPNASLLVKCACQVDWTSEQDGRYLHDC